MVENMLNDNNLEWAGDKICRTRQSLSSDASIKKIDFDRTENEPWKRSQEEAGQRTPFVIGRVRAADPATDRAARCGGRRRSHPHRTPRDVRACGIENTFINERARLRNKHQTSCKSLGHVLLKC